jgi:cell division protein FtsN
MASQNRRNYGGYSNRSNGLAFVRGAFIMLVVLILSFGLGFFVLARFMPGGQKPETNHPGIAIASTRGETETGSRLPSASTGQPPRTQTQKSAPPVTPKVAPEGPSIGPGDENLVQQPGKLDGTGKSGENQDDPNKTEPTKPEPKKADPGERPAPRTKPHPREKADPAAGNPETNETTAPMKRSSSDDDPNLVGATKPHKSGRKASKSEGDIPKVRTESPRSIESNLPAGPAPRDTPAPRTTVPKTTGPKAPAVTGLYRVQLGAFDTREQAEQIIKEAQGKGFDAQIKVVKKGDQTLYKVQHSAHKTRANAEKEGQRLTEAGFPVYIANPDR